MAYEYEFTVDGLPGHALASRFDGLHDLQDWLDAKRQAGRYTASPFEASKTERAHMAAGKPSMVAPSDAFLDKVKAEAPDAMTGATLQRVMAGGMPDVPAFLAGHPVAMRQRQRREAPAPLRIVVNLTTSAYFGDDALARRGYATLALLRLLEGASHPVELWTVHGCSKGFGGGPRGAFCFVKLDSSPIDLSRAAWALSDSEFSRQIAYAANTTRLGDYVSAWPWAANQWAADFDKQVKTMAAAMGIVPSDMIYLPPLFSPESGEDFTSDAKAVAWVNKTYADTLAKATF